SDYLLDIKRSILDYIKAEVNLEFAKDPRSEFETDWVVQLRYNLIGELFDPHKGTEYISFAEMVKDSLSLVWDFQFKSVDVDTFFNNEDNRSHPLPSYEEIQKEKERRAWQDVSDKNGISLEKIRRVTNDNLLGIMRDNRSRILVGSEQDESETEKSLLQIILDNRSIIADLAASRGTEVERELNTCYVSSLLAGSQEVHNAVNQYEQTHPLPSEGIQNKAGDPQTQQRQDFKEEAKENKDPDTFIQSLQVSYVNDTGISIKIGDKQGKDYTCKEMGFKSSENGWKLLMEVLRDRDHSFYVGPYSKDKSPEKIKWYNQRQKWMSEFNKKFISFLNREYGVQIPSKTKLFENQKKKDRDGMYKPIFQITSQDAIYATNIKKMSKEEVLNELEKLTTDRSHVNDAETQDLLLTRIGLYATYATKMGWITKEDLQKMILVPDEEISPDDALSHVDKWADINNR
ncbi:MAG TPA: hypothetical protein PK528_14075, partial [Syntrophorhabdus sp.]|nr:hypothetical protein [Syntrophorhabdus sp.]